MKCYICGKEDKGNFCLSHAKELKNKLDNNESCILKPEFKHHCLLCNEFIDRIILYDKNYGYFCNIDIVEEFNKYL